MKTPISGVSFILRTIIGFLFTAKPHHEKNWYKICIKFLRLTDRDIIAVLRLLNTSSMQFRCVNVVKFYAISKIV